MSITEFNGKKLSFGYGFQKIEICEQFFRSNYQRYSLNPDLVMRLSSERKLHALCASNLPTNITQKELINLAPQYIQCVVIGQQNELK